MCWWAIKAGKSGAFLALAALWLGLLSAPLGADTLEVEIEGIDGALLSNVRAYSSLVAAERLDDASTWRLRQMASDTREEIREALRPFGYYRPRIEVRLIEPENEGPWRARLVIDPGRPTTVVALEIDIAGEAAQDPEFEAWQDDWPLSLESRLVHAEYQAAWQTLARLAEQRGYFDARFVERSVIVDPDRAEATIRIHFDSGQRYRFAGYAVDDTPFSARLFERLDILEEDEAYSAQRLDEQREALVRSGLFQRVVIDTEQDAETARVGLRYQLEARKPSSYRATLGFGTDTGARAQLAWTRHYLSSIGNRLEVGLGAQQENREYVLRADYRHPRGSSPRDFWIAGTTLRSEQDDFRFIDENRIEAVFESYSGRRDQVELVLGRLKEREAPIKLSQPVEERLFVAALDESFDALREARFSAENEALLAANPELEPFLATETQTLALGASWRLANVSGSGFFSQGQILNAQLLGASESLGSDVSFAQGWLSGRWHQIFGDRHKLLLRGEIGYTEADTTSIEVALDDRVLDLSITELPERYRFKTGGDRTVRGYAFEALSTNRNGGNNILAGSAEYEYRVGQDWSLAAFYDIGNAFNDFDQIKLKRGIGAGFRWYTVIGPIQVDFAQALDDAGKPWRLHLTIGTRLL